MAGDNKFVTYKLTVPASRKGQDVSYLRRMESAGRSIETLITGVTSSKTEKELSGFAASYEAETKNAVLTFTTLKKNEALLQSAMQRALKYRGKGMFSYTAQQRGTVSGGPAAYTQVSMGGMSDRARSGVQYKALKDLGTVPSGDTLNVPENIRYSDTLKGQIKSQIDKEATAPSRRADHIVWKRDLERERMRRSIDTGVEPSKLDYTVPVDNPNKVTQDFVDKQNKFLAAERQKTAQNKTGNMMGTISKIAALMFLIQRTVLKIYDTAKQGATRGLETMMSSIELGLGTSTITRLRNQETGVGLAEGTTEKGLKRLLGAFNTPDALAANEKMLGKLALLSSNTSQRNLTQSAVDVATSGASIMPVFNGILAAAKELISKQEDVFGKKMPTQAQSMRSVVQYISSNISPEIGALIAHQAQYKQNVESSNAAMGLGIAENDVSHAAALATAIGELNNILSGLKEVIASLVDKSGVVEKLNTWLISHFGTKEEKAQLVSYNQQVNRSRRDVLKAEMSRIAASSDVQGFTSLLTEGAAQAGFDTSKGMLSVGGIGKVSLSDLGKWISGEKSYMPDEVSFMSKSLSAMASSGKLSENQKKYVTDLQAQLPDMALYAEYMGRLKGAAGKYNAGKTSVNMVTPQTIAQETLNYFNRDENMQQFQTWGAQSAEGTTYGNKTVRKGLSKEEYQGTIYAGIIKPVLDNIEKSAGKASPVTSNIDLTNNIKITTPEGTRDYTDKRSYSTASPDMKQAFSRNIYEGTNSTIGSFNRGNVISNLGKATQSQGN